MEAEAVDVDGTAVVVVGRVVDVLVVQARSPRQMEAEAVDVDGTAVVVVGGVVDVLVVQAYSAC